MSLYVKNNYYTLYHGKMQEELNNLEDNSIDSIITDPPYELGFMGKSWDNSGVAFQANTWEKCLRVLKPGGYLLAFGGSRTFHRIACAIEDAGFEIRDTIMWIYGSGFPKSMNIGLAVDKKNGVESPIVGQNEDILKKQAKDIKNGKRKIVESLDNGAPERNNGFKKVSADIKQAQNEWSGWGTCLKPAYEPIIVARKPFDGSLVDNILEYGVGGLNIDECRVGNDYISGGTMPDMVDIGHKNKEMGGLNKIGKTNVENANRLEYEGHYGRFPANVITDGSEEVAEGFPQSKGAQSQNVYTKSSKYGGNSLLNSSTPRFSFQYGYNDDGSAMRYFYCAKAGKKDRDEGLDGFSESKVKDGRKAFVDNPFQRGETLRTNIHPTVKPTDLMQYLIRLVSPRGSTILDPFMGSGSTGKACMIENQERNAGYKFIGIEMTDEYLPIADARIRYWVDNPIEEEQEGHNEIKKDTVCQLW